MNLNYLRGFVIVTAAMLFGGFLARAAETPVVQRVTGEIGWVDVKLGKLELHQTTTAGTETTAYRITLNETRVTDTADKQFLSVDDLRAGQYVTVEATQGQPDTIVQKIIVEPMPVSDYQQAFGELKSIDVVAGTLVVEERVRIGQEEKIRVADFVFDPNTVVVMHSPSKEAVKLFLKPGDVIKVEFKDIDGKQQAHYITLYSSVVTSTTTTTTTTITH